MVPAIFFVQEFFLLLLSQIWYDRKNRVLQEGFLCFIYYSC